MGSLIDQAKTLVRRRPWLFDAARRWKRRLPWERDAAYEFFRDFSRRLNNDVTFIQVGASDGLRNDPIREHVIAHGWRGVLIEPIPSAFELLRRNYQYLGNHNLKFLKAAVSDTDGGQWTFYSFDEDFLARQSLEQRLSYLRKSSFDRAHVEQFVTPEEQRYITKMQVPVLSLSTIVRQHLSQEQIHLLVIDAEGHEATIIESIDFNVLLPDAIFFESHNLGSRTSQVSEILAKAGYVVRTLGGDSLATRN